MSLPPLPRPLKLILAAFLLLAGAVSVINPLFESTDEIRHYRYVRHLITQHTLPVQGAEEARSQSHHPPLYYALSALASAAVPCPHTAEYRQPPNPFWGYRNWAVGVDNKLQYLHLADERFPYRHGYLAAMIPRWVNVLLGAITVWLTWALARRLRPDAPPLAWGAAALVAFTPQFIYLSAAMTNDILAAAMGTAVVLQSVIVCQDGLSRRAALRLGLLYGLALLTKLHLAALGAILLLAIARTPATRRREKLATAGIALGMAALLAGWWFVRNWRLYGDPTGLTMVNQLWAGRSAAGNWWALWQGLPYLWSSLWGRFGYGQIPLPRSLYLGWLLFTVLGLGGYLRPRPARPRLARGAALLGVTVLLFVLIVAYYILIQPAGAMGRFLFPAWPSFAVLLAHGWARLVSPKSAALGLSWGLGGLAVVALGGYLLPAVTYPPTGGTLPAGAVVQYGDVARMAAITVAPSQLHPGEPLFVTVAWLPLRQTPGPLTVYVHLTDEAGVLVAQRDTWPGLGRAPTTAWHPGRVFRDTYRVDLPETAYTPDTLSVQVGLYDETGRQPVYDQDARLLGDGVTVGTATLLPPENAPVPNPLHENFNNEVTLVGYHIEPRVLTAGSTLTLTLYWQATPQRRQDYFVFAQVLDAQWHVWGSKDGPGPAWGHGEIVRDVRRITIIPQTPPGSYPIQVGVFSAPTGRLSLLAPDGRPLDDHVTLGPVRVLAAK